GMAKKPAVDEVDILDPYDIAPKARAKKDLPTVEDLQQELKNCTPADIGNRIVESMSTIEKVVDSSRNLRGSHAQSLRIAARSALAAASELALRTSTVEIQQLQMENDKLRSELTNLKSELTRLTTEVNSLHQKGSRTEYPIQESGLKIVEHPLAYHIAELVDQKLADFRAEVLSDIRIETRTESQINTGKEKKNARKTQKIKAAQVSQSVASEEPSKLQNNPEL
ncbi:jg24578, partial [Pararge aegeria aegeria]